MTQDYFIVREGGRTLRIRRLEGWYIGSKSKMLEWIWRSIQKRSLRYDSVLDGFSGSGCVGYLFKQLGKRVTSVDQLSFAVQIAKALIENNTVKLSGEDRMRLFDTPPNQACGFIEREFGDILFGKANCRFLDQLWQGIQRFDDPYKQALTYYAACMVAYQHAAYGTFSLQRQHFNRQFQRERQRLFSFKGEFLRALAAANQLVFDNGQQNQVLQGDTIELAKSVTADLVYWDPPYGPEAASDYFRSYEFLEDFVQYRRAPKPTTLFTGRNLEGFERLFTNAQHIPVWVLAYFENNAVPVGKLQDLMQRYKRVVELETLKVEYVSRRTGPGKRGKSATEVMLVGWD